MTAFDQTNEHVWTREQMAAVLTGGLSGEELARFEAHVRSCADCSTIWNQMQDEHQRLGDLFQSAQPAAGLEDRIIQRVRIEPSRRRLIHPAVRFAATGIAAAIILGGFGFMVNRADERAGTVASSQRLESDGVLSIANKGIRRGRSDSSNRGESAIRQMTSRGGTLTLGTAVVTDNDFESSGKGVTDLKEPAPGAKRGGSVAGEARAPVATPETLGMPLYKKNETGGGPGGSGGAGGGGGGGQAESEARHYWFDAAEAGKPVEGKSADVRFEPETLRAGLSGKEISEVTDAARAPEKEVMLQIAAKPVPAEVPALAQATTPTAGVPIQEQSRPATAQSRKIIRNGAMEFEVERFDSAFAIVSKLTAESGGYIGTTDSEKLPNGKVKGTVILRVPPDRLDALVLQLRSLGDLKSQKLEAQDISKQYQDMDSALTAARAMEARLLEIIKTSKGQIKDLLAAEKELGTWREKIEKLVGEMKYYDNLVSLSTLSITLYEKDIKTAAAAIETETIDTGVETSDVEKARTDALKAIEEAKGRVVQSDLKRFDAGQLAATIVAEVSADRAGPLLDRLKQLGKVARLDIQRKQTDSESGPQTRVERKETRFNISFYNLANVAPRVTTNLVMAVEDVEPAYRAILARVEKAGGRIVTSNLNRAQADRVSGTIGFDLPSAEADAVASELKSIGEEVKLTLTENPDAANVTTAKRGFNVQLVSAAGIPPRQTTQLAVEVADVDAAVAAMQSAAGASAKILQSNLSKDRDGRTLANLVLEGPLAQSANLIDVARKLGTVRAFESLKNEQAPDAKLARARIEITLASPEAIVEPGQGLWASVRNALSTSAAGLLWSLRLVIVGLCFVVPWVVLLWGGWKLYRKRGKTPVNAGLL